MAITGASGTLAQGNAITISGSGFGTKSPAAPMIYDDFSGGTPGNDPAGDTPLVRSGDLSSYTWVSEFAGNPSHSSLQYNNSSPHPRHGQHVRGQVTNSLAWGAGLQLQTLSHFTTGNKIYVSFDARYALNSGATHGRQVKMFQLFNSGGNDRAYFSSALNNCEGGNFRLHVTSPTHEDGFAVAANDLDDEWMRHDSYLVQGTVSSANGIWEGALIRPSLGTPTQEIQDFGGAHTMRDINDEWVKFHFGASYLSIQCGATDYPAHVDVTDFYFDLTPKRVEMGNASTYAACTMRELWRATAWSDTEITALANLGYFGDTATAWLYVLDDNNDPLFSGNGFEITLGGGGGGGPAFVPGSTFAYFR